MSRSHTVKKSSTSSKRNTAKKSKKICPSGLACPYINEYQHNSEYSHSVDSNRPAQKGKEGKKLCDLGTSCPYQEEFQHLLEYDHVRHPTAVVRGPFSGSSQVVGCPLGGERGKRGGNSVDGEDLVRKKRCAALGAPHIDLTTEHVECHQCGVLVSLPLWDSHARQHELDFGSSRAASVGVVSGGGSSSSQLRQEQEAEYEEHQLRDILRLSREEHLKERSRGNLSQLSLSSSSAKLPHDPVSSSCSSRDVAIIDLSSPPLAAAMRKVAHPEELIDLEDNYLEDSARGPLQWSEPPSSPPADTAGCVTIAFRLPQKRDREQQAAHRTPSKSRSGRVSRRFFLSDTVQDLFSFVRSVHAPADMSTIELRSVVGSRRFTVSGPDMLASLQGLGITENTLLVVHDSSL